MKIVFIPMDGYGHVNACIGLACMLRDYGHECIFAVSKPWSRPVDQHKFTVETLDDPTVTENQDLLAKWGKFMNELSHTFKLSPKSQFVELIVPACKAFVDYAKIIDPQLPAMLNKVNPDLIIMDFYVTLPALIKSGLPWIRLCSCNPLEIYDGPNVPPSGFGLSVDTEPTISSELKVFMAEAMRDVKTEADNWLVSQNLDPDPASMVTSSPYLNIYAYPSDLDYTEFGPIPNTWFRLDHMVRKSVQQGQDPLGFDESFFSRRGKKIFFTLGSMGAIDIDLMKNLVAIMSQSTHQFIIAKGPFHDKFELTGNNMVGGRYVNQMAILPRVDLVIHHGGNNTFLETLYFGKPCIVLPLSGDQHDNGRRVEDKKIGRCFYPYQMDPRQFLTAIDELTNDDQLIERVNRIGQKMRSSKRFDVFNEKIKHLSQLTIK